MNHTAPTQQPVLLATRASPLAMRQADIVRQRLLHAAPRLPIQLVPMQTQGDVTLLNDASSLSGKGLFLKEIEEALLDGRGHVAVHSLKDVPFPQTPGLTIAATLDAIDPRDALITKQGLSLDQLPEGAAVGTNSLRRQAQVLSARPDLRVLPLRGNVGSRLQKLFDGQYDAIILAAAGLQRLGLSSVNLTCNNMHFFDVMQWLPAPCQGVLALQCRSDDQPMLELLAMLDESATRQRTCAERSFAARLGADCRSALAAHAVCLPAATMVLHGWVASPNGAQSIRLSRSAPSDGAHALGIALAEDFLRAGAAQVLHGCAQRT